MDQLFECVLPLPPPANNLFVNSPNGGRFPSKRYTAWKALAGIELRKFTRGLAMILCPVNLELEYSEKSRADLDGLPKAPIDLLVAHGVLPDDNKRFVRRITLSWSAAKDGVRIIIYRA